MGKSQPLTGPGGRRLLTIDDIAVINAQLRADEVRRRNAARARRKGRTVLTTAAAQRRVLTDAVPAADPPAPLPGHPAHGVALPQLPDTHAHRQENANVLRAHLEAEHGWDGRSQDPAQLAGVHGNLHIQMEAIRARALAAERKKADELARVQRNQQPGRRAPKARGPRKRIRMGSVYALAGTDVVHLLRASETTYDRGLCGYWLEDLWWKDSWQPGNYPMCGACERLEWRLPAAPRKWPISIVSGGLPGLGKRR